MAIRHAPDDQDPNNKAARAVLARMDGDDTDHPGAYAAVDMDVEVPVAPSYDAIDGELSVGNGNNGGNTYDTDFARQPPQGPAAGVYDLEDPANGPGEKVNDYDLEDPLQQGVHGRTAAGHNTYDMDFLCQPPQGPAAAYDLEDPTNAGYGRMPGPAKAVYDLGHQDASGDARVGHLSHYGNTGGAHFAVEMPTAYDHDSGSMSEEEI